MKSDQARQAVCHAVAEMLRKERLKRGLSMTVVAQQAGLSQQMVSYVERGMRNPTLDTLLRLTHVLHVDLGGIIRRACSDSSKCK